MKKMIAASLLEGKQAVKIIRDSCRRIALP